MNTWDADVLVVGAGPAGVIAAYTVAKQGRTVILTDSKPISEIGNKVCGDALRIRDPDYVKRHTGLEIPNGNEVCDTIDYFVIKTRKNELAFEVPKEGIVVNRHIYGQRLLAETQRIGVTVMPQRQVSKPIIEGSAVKGALVKNLETLAQEKLSAKITIDCSGRNYVIRRNLPKEKFPLLETSHPQDEMAVAYREIIRLNRENPFEKRLVLVYDESAPEPGFFWFFSKGRNEINAGLGWMLSTANSGKPIKAFYKRILAKYFDRNEYEVLESGSYTLPMRFPLLNAVADGFMTAGDAAFHVDPFTAEGHGPALTAGYLAGKNAVLALDNNDPTTAGLWNYNLDVLDRFGHTHIKSQLFVAMLYSFGMERFWDFMLSKRIFTFDEFRAIRHGKKLSNIALVLKAIKMYPRWHYLFKFNYFAKSIKNLRGYMEEYPHTPKDYERWNASFSSWLKKTLQNF